MGINLKTKIGFEDELEFLPKFDMFDTKQKQRELFLKFYNTNVQKEFRFTKDEIRHYKQFHLKDIFIKKIDSLIDVNFISSRQVSKFLPDMESSAVINSFKTSIGLNSFTFSPKLNNVANKKNSIKNASHMIENCFEGMKFTIKFDADDMFSQFVFNKVKRRNRDKKTSRCDNCIDIVSTSQTTTKIFTYWEFLNKDNLDINHAVNLAVDTIKKSDFNQIYLVYPKNKNFDKHIQVRSHELEACSKVYDIKVIPYSLRSILR